MSLLGIASAILLGPTTNEFDDLSPWLAGKLVIWSAKVHCGETDRAEIRAEELAALINDRPGKLLKLITSSRFAIAAIARRARRSHETKEPVDLFALRFGPSELVSRYLILTEKYRGEWPRHWIDP